jgi:hypothetical protein
MGDESDLAPRAVLAGALLAIAGGLVVALRGRS